MPRPIIATPMPVTLHTATRTGDDQVEFTTRSTSSVTNTEVDALLLYVGPPD